MVSSSLLELGFISLVQYWLSKASLPTHDSNLFIRRSDDSIVFILLYVDDMVIMGDDLLGIRVLQQFLNQQFEMKNLGFLSYFSGLEVSSY